MDPALFVPVRSTRPRTTHDLTPALAVCHRCPVIRECLAHALLAKEHGAVWGGEYLSDGRVRQLRAQRRGLTA
jgi:WhiB family redox-sensing transcriptional regulator